MVVSNISEIQNIDFLTAEVTLVPAENSLGFLENVFKCYAQEDLFAITRPDTSLGHMVGTLRQSTLATPPQQGWGRFDYTPNVSDAPAQIVFTSGTEGQPKPIVISHRSLADVVLRLNEFMQVNEEIREYIGVPVTYSFGLGRARAVAAAGGQFFIPERFDPIEIRKRLEADEINAISAVPSLWRMLLAIPDAIGEVGKRVRWIEIGSQQMAGQEKSALAALFPNAKIVQHYGLTEASRTTFLDVSEGSALESVGATTGNAELKITAEGAIAIRGDHVALGQLSPEGKLVSLTDNEGWLVTKDKGEIRDGQLYYLGRFDDQINIAGIKVAAETVEHQITTMVPMAVGSFAVTGVPDPHRGEAVLVAIDETADDQTTLIEEAAKTVLGRLGIDAAGSLHFLHLAAFPRTQTNKIRRSDLRAIFSASKLDKGKRPRPASDSPSVLSDAENDLATVWQQIAGPVALSPEQSFYDIGGDSLSAVQIGIAMDMAGYDSTAVRATLEGRSLRKVAEQTANQGSNGANVKPLAEPLPDRTVRTWAINLTRGVMVLSVVLSHWGPGLFARFGLLEEAESILSILYRMGTPGFAAVFGIGIGVFILPRFQENKVSALKRMRASFLLVLSGLCLLAAVQVFGNFLKGRSISGQSLSFAFYGVLAYYVIMLGSARLWLPALARLRSPIAGLLFLAPILWLAWQLAMRVVSLEQQDSLWEWPRLMSIAGYSVFKLSALTAAGIAAGLWFTQQRDTAHAGKTLLLVGGLGSFVSILALMQVYGVDVFATRRGPAFTSLQGLLLYIFLSLFMLGGFTVLMLRWDQWHSGVRFPLQLLIVVGALALPIYVFHGLVLPLRGIFVLSGLPSPLALAIPMAFFLGSMGYAGWRIYQMYFR